jgi:hypothetical protein
LEERLKINPEGKRMKPRMRSEEFRALLDQAVIEYQLKQALAEMERLLQLIEGART